jgi:uncharacterized protein (TIGR00369 family)
MNDASDTRFGMVPLDVVKTMTGLELLRAIIAGKLPGPPIAKVLDFTLVEVEHGRAVFEGTPHFDYYNPLGSVHGGYSATLLDSCMGCAVHTTMEKGFGYTTLEFKINFVRALTADTGKVRAEGRLLHGGRRAATSEGKLTDSSGKLLAHATTTCLVFPL